jgi:phosphoglycolate phosphatase
MPRGLVIFDFDGTLADSFPFFLRVFDLLAEEHGYRRASAGEIALLRRSSAREVMRHVGLPAWRLPLVARDFIRLLRTNRGSVPLFEGVAAVLEELRCAGVQVGVVSSNSYDNVLAVLGDAARAVRHFECGASIFGKRSRLEKLRRRAGVDRDATIYVGDQATGLEAARAARIAFGAVAWGYGDFDALRSLAPDETFVRVHDLRRLVGQLATDTSRELS